jgi:hypothetical protein
MCNELCSDGSSTNYYEVQFWNEFSSQINTREGFKRFSCRYIRPPLVVAVKCWSEIFWPLRKWVFEVHLILCTVSDYLLLHKRQSGRSKACLVLQYTTCPTRERPAYFRMPSAFRILNLCISISCCKFFSFMLTDLYMVSHILYFIVPQ